MCVLYRYLFFDWLFRNPQAGSLLERAAAERHNREQARWLPTYARRWLVIGVAFFATALLLEAVGLDLLSAACYAQSICTAPIITVALTGWLFLRRPIRLGDK